MSLQAHSPCVHKDGMLGYRIFYILAFARRALTEMYPILEEYFDSQGYRTLSQASFRMIKLWLIDAVAYDDRKRELIAVEAKLNLDDALDAISQAEMYQMACSKVYVAFPHTEWDSRNNHACICYSRNTSEMKDRHGFRELQFLRSVVWE